MFEPPVTADKENRPKRSPAGEPRATGVIGRPAGWAGESSPWPSGAALIGTGLAFSTWSLTKLAEYLAAAGIARISCESIRQILQDAGINWLATQTSKATPSPSATSLPAQSSAPGPVTRPTLHDEALAAAPIQSPGVLPAAGEGVDGHGGQQDQRGPHQLRGGGQADQLQAVGDHADDQAAEHGIQHLAPAAEQAGAADDRGGHGVQHVLAAVDAAGDRAEVGRVDDAGDAGGQPAQRERGDPDPVG